MTDFAAALQRAKEIAARLKAEKRPGTEDGPEAKRSRDDEPGGDALSSPAASSLPAGLSSSFVPAGAAVGPPPSAAAAMAVASGLASPFAAQVLLPTPPTASLSAAPPPSLSALSESSLSGSGPPSEEFLIPNAHVGKVIGKNGDTINRIQSQSGCRVQITQDSGVPLRKSTLTGPKDAIERAKTLIMEIVAASESAAAGALGPNMKTMEIMIPGSKVGLVIGKSGETIRQLQEKSGSKMQMIQDGEYAMRPEKCLRVTGEERSLQAAEKLVLELIADRTEPPPAEGLGGFTSGDLALNIKDFKSHRVRVDVPRVAVGSVIGRGGETIKRIQAETGVRMQFDPDDNGPHRTATISGTEEMVRHAENVVRDIITEAINKNQRGGMGSAPGAPSMGTSVRMSVTASKCGLVIGRGGETIKQIQNQSGAKVQICNDVPPDAPEKVFTITGTPQQIETAQNLIRQKVDGARPTPHGQMGPPFGSFPPHLAPPGFPPPPGFGFPPAGFPPNMPYPQYPYPGFPPMPGMPAAPQPPREAQPPPPAAAPAPAATPVLTEAQAIAAGYPSTEQYLANKEWYNSQGYFGYPGAPTLPASSTSSAAPAAVAAAPSAGAGASARPAQSAAPAAGSAAPQTAADYARQWEQYYAAQAAAAPR